MKEYFLFNHSFIQSLTQSFYPMKHIKPYYLLLITAIISWACSSEPTHQIPELPDFDEASYYEYALASVEAVLEDDPDNAEALYQHAKLLLKQGKTNNALSSIRKAIEIDSDEPSYRLVSAQALLQKGQNREAFREAKTALSDGPSLELYEMLAEASLNSNYFADALKYSDSALALSPYNDQNYYRKGKAAARMQDTLLAEQNLLKSLKLGAEGADVYGTLVDMYMENDSYQKARNYMEKMLEEGQADNRVRFQQAKILRMTGMEDSAQAILYRLRADSDVNHTPVYQELTELYYQKRFYDSALHYAQQVLARQPEEKAIMLTAARIYDRRRQYQTAIRQYEAIVNLDSLQQPTTHRMAVQELDDLKRKVTYLWRKKQEEEFEKLKRLSPIQSITPGAANK